MSRRTSRIVALVLFSLMFASFGSALATEEPETTTDSESESDEDSARDRLLAEGRVVYEANCMACHQTNGEGISGVFPPLVDNPHVDDTAYLEEVILQGRMGEIVVDGVTYNGAMPAFSALSAEQVGALVLYVQEGLGEPIPVAPGGSTAPAPSGSDLPLSTVLAYTAGFGIFAVGFAAVAGPVALAKRSGAGFSTVQVWLKALLIFAYFVIATVFIPSLVVESSFLASPPSVYEDLFSGQAWGLVRDLIGTGVWLVALLFGFWALRRAQRQEII